MDETYLSFLKKKEKHVYKVDVETNRKPDGEIMITALEEATDNPSQDYTTVKTIPLWSEVPLTMIKWNKATDDLIKIETYRPA
jgi:hypothetical protein